MIRKLLVVMLLLGLVGLLTASSASAASSPTLWPGALAFTQIITGLSSPVAITHAGDSTGRLFITLKDGQIVIYDGSQILTTPFLDITSLVANSGEQGLLSTAFHPDYGSNGYFYVFYTLSPDGELVIARYTVSGDPNVADASSETILLTIPHPGATNHNGGQLQFGPGPDEYLYISTGDGSGGGSNAQSGTSLLGKILRLDVDIAAPYVPATNPFTSNGAVADEIWALGLRNPWRFSFDSATGDLIIADVGQNTWEEVNVQDSLSTGAENYGWPCYEGLHDYGSAICAIGTITDPVTEYNHGASDSIGCSITGGYRYRGSEYPNMVGVYFYGDFCTGRIWGAEPNGSSWTSVQLADTDYGISTFGEGEDGSLYLADLYSGTIYKLRHNGFVPTSFNYLPLILK